MSPDQDQQYITSALNGDLRAFEHLVNTYKAMVYTVALRMVRQSEDAEEIAQDTFVNAYKNLRKFKGESKFSTWLYKIVYNKALDHLKANRRNVLAQTVLCEGHDVLLEDDILKAMEFQDRRVIIGHALKQLQPQDHTLITFYYFEELSLKEISSIMGIKRSALKVRLFRSRKQLAKILSTWLEKETIAGYGKE